MDPRFFRFASEHELAAPPDAVFAVLAHAESWNRWWPQIRRITPHSDVTGEVRIRSVLPFTLVLELTSEVVDAASGVLRAVLAGDLEGWAQFTVTETTGGGTQLEYVQEARLVRPRLPGVVCRGLRPLLLANHAAMMRAGMRGLEVRARARAGGSRGGDAVP